MDKLIGSPLQSYRLSAFVRVAAHVNDAELGECFSSLFGNFAATNPRHIMSVTSRWMGPVLTNQVQRYQASRGGKHGIALPFQSKPNQGANSILILDNQYRLASTE